MALQTCQIIDSNTRGTVYLENWKGNVLVNNVTYPIQLGVEIIDVVNSVPVTFNSEQTVTLNQAPTGTIRQAILPLIQAIHGFESVIA